MTDEKKATAQARFYKELDADVLRAWEEAKTFASSISKDEDVESLRRDMQRAMSRYMLARWLAFESYFDG